MTDEVINYIRANKAVTLIDEVLLNFPEMSFESLFIPEITKELENNRIEMKKALKIKLFRTDTTEALLKLNTILDNENNYKQTSEFIDKIVGRWKNNEQ